MSQLAYTNLVDGDKPTASGFNTRFLLPINLLNSGIEADNIASNAVTTAKIADDAVTNAKLDDDGNYGQFTGSWRFNDLEATALSLPETTAPTTAAGEGALYTKDTGGQPELFYREESNGDEVQITSGGSLNSGAIVQVVNTQTGAVATGTTTTPDDDSIPQNTEGDEYMTLAITPTNSSNKLKIEVVAFGQLSTGALLTMALFQDTTVDALAAGRFYSNTTSTIVSGYTFTHYMTAGTTNSTTFKVRIGPSGAATFTFNGSGGARKLGGVMASSITITEIVP